MWRRKLRTASFRRIRFNLTNSESSHGRRSANHVFPLRDDPYTEDMGRKAREFSIEAFVVGPDYMRDRDRIIKACEQPGPGKLVHPYYGNRTVLCTGCEVRESSQEGGSARFLLTFREAGTLKFPTSRKNPKGLLELLGSSINENSINEFLDNYGVAAGPGFLAEQAQEKVTEFTEALNTTADLVNRVADETADFAFAVSDLVSDIEAIVRTPEVLAYRIQNSLTLLSSSISIRKDAANAQRGLFGFGAADATSAVRSTSRIRAEKNNNELNKLIGRAALVNGAIDLSEAEFESVEEAESVRDAYFAEIERQQVLEDTTDDVYQNLQQLKVEIAKAIPGDDQDLPNLVTYEIGATTNTLAVTYELYGALDKETDIIERNGIRNPGSVPGGEPLQVLRNV